LHMNNLTSEIRINHRKPGSSNVECLITTDIYKYKTARKHFVYSSTDVQNNRFLLQRFPKEWLLFWTRCKRLNSPPVRSVPRTFVPSHRRPWDAYDYSQKRPGGSQNRPTPYFTFIELFGQICPQITSWFVHLITLTCMLRLHIFFLQFFFPFHVYS
jgi:hypothetical protein